MTERTTNNELASQLGDVREQIGSLIQGQKHASEGRHVIHDKLDKLLDAVQTQAIAIAGASKDASLALQGAAQTRDRIDAFDREIRPIVADLTDEVQGLKNTNTENEPVLNTVRQVRIAAFILVGISGAGIVSIGSILLFANDLARSAVLNWLGLA